MQFDAILYSEITPFVIGATLLGLLVGAMFMHIRRSGKITALERQNAELALQVKMEREALERAGTELDNRFKVTAQEALQKSTEQFLLLAQEKFKNAQADGVHDLEKRQKAIDELVKPVHERLQVLSTAIDEVKGTDKALREDIRNLNRETAKLVGALRDPSAQGAWGEFILEGILEKSGLIKGLHYKTQVTLDTENGKQRPDAIIEMQDGFNIIIDSKAPLNEFAQRLSQELSEEEYKQIMNNLAVQVRDHVKKLGGKNYWENVNSPDFTVLFLPSEHMYSIALRSDPTLVEFAAAKNIIIASPTLLMSLLRVVGMSWRQVELAQNAQQISDLGLDLYKRFLKFTDHFEKVGGHLQKAMGGYDAAVGSLERQVLPAARKFKELQGAKAGIEELKDINTVEQMPRPLSLSVEDETEKKRA